MSQAIVNEVAKLKRRCGDLEHQLGVIQRAMQDLAQHVEGNYMRKRGPKKVEKNGEAATHI